MFFQMTEEYEEFKNHQQFSQSTTSVLLLHHEKISRNIVFCCERTSIPIYLQRGLRTVTIIIIIIMHNG